MRYLLLLLLSCSLAHGATYYALTNGNNANSGTVSNSGGAWRNLWYAAVTAASNDTIYAGPGTFNEYVTNTVNGITFIGAPNRGTIIDPSTNMSAGWVAAPEIGSGVYKKTGLPFYVAELTITNARVTFVYTTNTLANAANGYSSSPTTGSGWLTLGSASTVTSHGNTFQWWDTVWALFASTGTTTFLRLRDGSDPNGLDIRGSANYTSYTRSVVQPVINITSNNYITWRGFVIQGGAGGIYIAGATAHHINIESNLVINGSFGVGVFNGARENTVTGNEVLTYYYGGNNYLGAWSGGVANHNVYDTWKFLATDEESTFDIRLHFYRCGNSNVASYNQIHHSIGLGISLWHDTGMFTNAAAYGNTITNHVSVGIIMSAGETDTSVYDNYVADCGINFRFHGLNTTGETIRRLNVFRNRSWQPTVNQTDQHTYWHYSGSSSNGYKAEISIYQNSFSGGLAAYLDGGCIELGGNPNTYWMNNIMSGCYYWWTDDSHQTNSLLWGGWDYNSTTPPWPTYPANGAYPNLPAWWGIHNTTNATARWATNNGTSFALTNGSPEINSGLNLRTAYPLLPRNSSVIVNAWDKGALEYTASTAGTSTVYAATMSYSDVSNAYAVTANGDVLSTPAGGAVWTSGLAVSKAITLRGAGTNVSTGSYIYDDLADGYSMFIYTLVADRNTVMTGFGIQNYTNNTSKYLQTITVNGFDGDARRIRIYGNQFGNPTNSTYDLRVGVFNLNSCYGVIDHNTIYGWSNGVPAICGYFKGSSLGGTDGVNGFGDGAMAAGDRFGTEAFMFFENNEVTNRYTAGGSGGNLTAWDCQAGGRFVIRYNVMGKVSVESHGLEAQRERSGRAGEVYFNNFVGAGDRNTVGYFRGGTWLWFSNTVSGWGSPAVISLLNNRMNDELASPFGAADGRNPWDVNDAGNPFVTGTCSSATALTMTDSGKSWTVNQYAGYVLRKTSGKTITSMSTSGDTVTVSSAGHGFTNGAVVTICGANQQAYNTVYTITYIDANQFSVQNTFTADGSASGTMYAVAGNHCAEIVSNTSTKLTFKDSIYAGAYTMVFAAADTYEINKITHAMDMTGRVRGTTLGGVDSPAIPGGWNDQTTSACYAWGNSPTLNFSPSTVLLIVNGTHYNNDTVAPGYAVYRYPHALVSGISGTTITVRNLNSGTP